MSHHIQCISLFQSSDIENELNYNNFVLFDAIDFYEIKIALCTSFSLQCHIFTYFLYQMCYLMK